MLRPRFFCANAFSRTGYTFASPFAIAAGDMTKYFGAGAKVRQLKSTSVDGTVLTLNFEDATSIVAGQPYLVKPAANVDFSADGKVDVSDYIGVANYILTGSIYGNGSMTRVK